MLNQMAHFFCSKLFQVLGGWLFKYIGLRVGSRPKQYADVSLLSRALSGVAKVWRGYFVLA